MNIAIILSGGRGERIRSEVPKQYLEAQGERMIARPLRTFLVHPEVDRVIVVAEEAWHEVIAEEVKRMPSQSAALTASPLRFGPRKTDGLHSVPVVADRRPPDVEQPRTSCAPEGEPRCRAEGNVVHGPWDEISKKFMGFAKPGRNRQESVWNAMRAVEARNEDDIVIIHDAARPLVSAELISSLIEACGAHDGAMPVLPMKDTVYLGERVSGHFDGLSDRNPVDGMRIAGLLERERVFAGQAPEAFLFGKYYAANEALTEEELLKINGSSEVAVMAGMDIAMVPGEERNFKVTTAEDLERFRRIVQQE